MDTSIFQLDNEGWFIVRTVIPRRDQGQVMYLVRQVNSGKITENLRIRIGDRRYRLTIDHSNAYLDE